jgi:hypothetical protein
MRVMYDVLVRTENRNRVHATDEERREDRRLFELG